jgi:hypothetical protein
MLPLIEIKKIKKGPDRDRRPDRDPTRTSDGGWGRGPRCCGLCLILRRDFNSQSPQGQITWGTVLVDAQPNIVSLVLRVLCSDARIANACGKNFINFEGHHAVSA